MARIMEVHLIATDIPTPQLKTLRITQTTVYQLLFTFVFNMQWSRSSSSDGEGGGREGGREREREREREMLYTTSTGRLVVYI